MQRCRRVSAIRAGSSAANCMLFCRHLIFCPQRLRLCLLLLLLRACLSSLFSAEQFCQTQLFSLLFHRAQETLESGAPFQPSDFFLWRAHHPLTNVRNRAHPSLHLSLNPNLNLNHQRLNLNLNAAQLLLGAKDCLFSLATAQPRAPAESKCECHSKTAPATALVLPETLSLSLCLSSQRANFSSNFSFCFSLACFLQQKTNQKLPPNWPDAQREVALAIQVQLPSAFPLQTPFTSKLEASPRAPFGRQTGPICPLDCLSFGKTACFSFCSVFLFLPPLSLQFH